MRSINNFFVKNIKKILFKENKSRDFLINNLLKENCDILVSIWDNIRETSEVYNKYKIDSANNFKIELLSIDDDFKIISIYLPYAINEGDYLIVSFINNHPERMFFSGIELTKEKVVDNYKKSYILINCFSYWKDEKTHFRNIIISNEFKIFDIYYNLYLENLQKNDLFYIPIKKDFDMLTNFFMNVVKPDIESYIYDFKKNLSSSDLKYLEKSYSDVSNIVKDFFNVSLQLSVKRGEICIVPKTILISIKYIQEHTPWFKQNEKMFYSSQIDFIDFYYNAPTSIKTALYNLIYSLLSTFPNDYEFIDIDKKTCCLL